MSEFYPINRDEMEDLLFNELNFPPQHNSLNMPGVRELVYGRGFKVGDLTISLRVYTSILPNGVAAPVGSDAIRCCTVLRRPDGEIRGLGKTKRVHRVTGWRKNLTNRINDMVDSLSDIVTCPKCGLPMAERKGANGKFWGCVDYPQCRGTRPH